METTHPTLAKSSVVASFDHLLWDKYQYTPYTPSQLTAHGFGLPVLGLPRAPAISGPSFEHDRNKNTKFSVHAKHLAKPESLTPPKSTYVVWIQGRGKDAQNAGVLRINENLEGSMSGTTPFQVFDIFVTAEGGASVDRPSGPEVMRGAVQQH